MPSVAGGCPFVVDQDSLQGLAIGQAGAVLALVFPLHGLEVIERIYAQGIAADHWRGGIGGAGCVTHTVLRSRLMVFRVR